MARLRSATTLPRGREVSVVLPRPGFRIGCGMTGEDPGSSHGTAPKCLYFASGQRGVIGHTMFWIPAFAGKRAYGAFAVAMEDLYRQDAAQQKIQLVVQVSRVVSAQGIGLLTYNPVVGAIVVLEVYDVEHDPYLGVGDPIYAPGY